MSVLSFRDVSNSSVVFEHRRSAIFFRLPHRIKNVLVSYFVGFLECVSPLKREKKKEKSCQVSFWDNSCLNDITPRSEVAIVLRLAEVGHICHGRLLLNIQNCAYSKSGACRKIGHANYSDSIGARSAERFSSISQSHRRVFI